MGRRGPAGRGGVLGRGRLSPVDETESDESDVEEGGKEEGGQLPLQAPAQGLGGSRVRAACSAGNDIAMPIPRGGLAPVREERIPEGAGPGEKYRRKGTPAGGCAAAPPGGACAVRVRDECAVVVGGAAQGEGEFWREEDDFWREEVWGDAVRSAVLPPLPPPPWRASSVEGAAASTDGTGFGYAAL